METTFRIREQACKANVRVLVGRGRLGWLGWRSFGHNCGLNRRLGGRGDVCFASHGRSFRGFTLCMFGNHGGMHRVSMLGFVELLHIEGFFSPNASPNSLPSR